MMCACRACQHCAPTNKDAAVLFTQATFPFVYRVTEDSASVDPDQDTTAHTVADTAADASPHTVAEAPAEAAPSVNPPANGVEPASAPMRVGVRARLVMLPKKATKAAWGAVAPVRAPADPPLSEAPPNMSPLGAGVHGLAAQEAVPATPARTRSRGWRATSPPRARKADDEASGAAVGKHVRSRSHDNVLVVGSSGEPVAVMVRSHSGVKDGLRRHSAGARPPK